MRNIHKLVKVYSVPSWEQSCEHKLVSNTASLS